MKAVIIEDKTTITRMPVRIGEFLPGFRQRQLIIDVDDEAAAYLTDIVKRMNEEPRK